MVNQISPPFPVFHDQNGDQLENGFVYIGEADQNPETNPANVFWDEAMTQPAQQPLRTIGGRFTRNGSPANVFTPSAYSITVRKANRRIVYSDLNISSVGTQNMFLGVVPQATLSVSSNSINLASATGGARDILVTSTGSTATLNTISGGTLGEFLTIRPDVGRTITVVHNASAAGNEIYLPRGENVVLNGNEVTLLLRYDGSNWIAQGGTGIGGQTFQLLNDTSPQLGGVLDTNSRQVRFSRGPNATAATTLSLSPTGNSFDVVGNTTISGIANVSVGTEVKLTFSGTPQLTNGSNFILPGGANIATAAGDVAYFEQISSSPIRWRCTNYEKADGTAIVSQVVAGLGYSGETWQDETSNRVALTSYQNTEGHPIMVSVSTSGICVFEVSLNNTTWVPASRTIGDPFASLSVIIPNNQYYRLDRSVTVNLWTELK